MGIRQLHTVKSGPLLTSVVCECEHTVKSGPLLTSVVCECEHTVWLAMDSPQIAEA